MNPVPNGDEPATKRDIERVVGLLVQRYQVLNRGFDAIDRRMGRQGDAVISIQGQMAGVTKWAGRLDWDNSTILAVQPRVGARYTSPLPPAPSFSSIW